MIERIVKKYNADKKRVEVTYCYDDENNNDIVLMSEIEKMLSERQNTCFNCENFYYEGSFGGYQACSCRIYGCLEAYNNPHHDCDGTKCENYNRVNN